MANKTPDNLLLKIEEYFNQGYSIHEIVELVNLSYSTVNRVVQKIVGKRNRSCRKRPAMPPPTDEEIRKISELMDQNYGSAEIGRVLDRPQSSCHRVLCFIKLSRIEHLTRREAINLKRYLRVTKIDPIIRKLKIIKKALGEEHIPLREDLINDLFMQPAQKKSIVSSTPAPLTTELEDLKNEFNNQIKCIQMQIEILTETIMEIKNGKNN